MLKRILSLCLAMLLVLSLCACGGETAPETTTEAATEPTEETAEATEAPTTELATEATTAPTTEATEAPTEEEIPEFTQPEQEKTGSAAGIAIGVMAVSAAGIGIILYALRSGKKSKTGKYQA